MRALVRFFPYKILRWLGRRSPKVRLKIEDNFSVIILWGLICPSFFSVTHPKQENAVCPMDYASFVKTACALKGYQLPNGLIHLTRNVRDIDGDCNRSYFTPHTVTSDGVIAPMCPPVEAVKCDIEASSPSGDKTVHMSTVDGNCIVEIFDAGSLTLRIDASEQHDKAIGDNWFGGWCFSSDEKRLVYVAAPKKPKTTTFFDKPETINGSDDSVSAPAAPSANKYSYKEDWGEKYTGISELGLYVLTLATGVIYRISGPGLDGGETVGQPVFTPCGRGVVYTSWPTTPKRLGMIYCYQRPCRIKVAYMHEEGVVDGVKAAQQQVYTLTPHLKLARYPVFAPSINGKDANAAMSLVFLGSEEGFDMHNNSAQLFVFDFSGFDDQLSAADRDLDQNGTNAATYCRVIIDHVPGAGIDFTHTTVTTTPSTTVDTMIGGTIDGYSFPGLFAGGLKARSFICPDVLLVESQWRSCAAVLCVNITTGDIRVLSYDNPSSSFVVSAPFNTKANTSVPTTATAGENKLTNLTPEQLAESGVIGASWLSECPFSASLIDCSPCTTDENSYRALLTVSSPTISPRLACFTRDDFIAASTAATTGPASITTAVSKFMNTVALCKTNISKTASSDCMTATTTSTTEETRVMTSYILHTQLVYPSYSTTIESVLLLPVQELEHLSPPPLLVSPHGGPHSAFSTTYVAQYNYLAAAGFAVLMVNYRGSTGFGKELLETLPGRIGVQDVFDVFAATESMLAVSATFAVGGKSIPPAEWPLVPVNPTGTQAPLVDKDNIGIMGGSHGGFLTAHCIGQKPSFFQAAVLRNPVTNVLANSMTSDIGDWCVVEGCGAGTYDFSKFNSPTMAELAIMYECSPVRYVDKVTTPVLLCLGAVDRRVPHHQGIEYYHALKSVSPLSDECIDMKIYPQADHAIDKPNSEADQFISMNMWFKRFLLTRDLVNTTSSTSMI